MARFYLARADSSAAGNSVAERAARLTTAGLGASKPIDSNDTPLGRAQNRRVELVRQ